MGKFVENQHLLQYYERAFNRAFPELNIGQGNLWPHFYVSSM